MGGFDNGVDWPPACPAPSNAHGVPCHTLQDSPPGYDYSICTVCHSSFNLSQPAGVEDSTEDCGGATMSSLPLVLAIAIYMFYGLALVCEEFMVPSLTVLCTRYKIPAHVAGATLLAAGCNAPELIASLISIFVTRSTVGAGTVVGSAPFNILGICGAAALAVGGFPLDPVLMMREVVSLAFILGAFFWVMTDNLVMWYEAVLLFSLYVAYVVLCVLWDPLVAVFLPPRTTVKQSSGDYIEAGELEILDIEPAVVPEGHEALIDVEWQRFAKAAQRRRRHQGDRVADDSSEAGLAMHGTLLKRSPFFSMSTHVRAARLAWQPRYFVLDGDKNRPFRYFRLDSDGEPAEDMRTVIDLASIHKIERSGADGKQLRISTRRLQAPSAASALVKDPYYGVSRVQSEQVPKRGEHPWALSHRHPLPGAISQSFTYKPVFVEHHYEMRLMPGMDVRQLDAWFDRLILKVDKHIKLAAAGKIQPPVISAEEQDETFDGEEKWWRPPSDFVGRVLYALVIPLKAAIHLTTPNVENPKYRSWYVATLTISLVWLVILATVMTSALDKMGCIIGFSSTVMGLTLGAAGTSFPNMFASIITARQGQAGMAVVQAFAANSFNVCVALGLLWVIQTGVGTCSYGRQGHPDLGSCSGCFMPAGIIHSCPKIAGEIESPEPGSLAGTVLFTFVCILSFLVALVVGRGEVSKPPAIGFCILYTVYAAYQVAAQRDYVPALCWGSTCL